MPDGTFFPAKIELVRVAYGNDYAVAAYLHDLREHSKMMEEVEQRDNLLRMGNRAAEILLTNEQELNIDETINNSLELAAVSVNADRIQIWRNKQASAADEEGEAGEAGEAGEEDEASEAGSELSFVRVYEWMSAVGRENSMLPANTKHSYSEKPEWEKLFLQGGYINGPLSEMSQDDQAFFAGAGIKTKAIIPLFLHDEFWGLLFIDDCRNERVFTGDEVNIMRSIGLMMANAILRYEMLHDIRDSSIKLEAALLESQRANSAKSNFLAKMSHEMRTPLNAVIGLSGLSLESNKLDDDTYASLEKIYVAGATLLATVNDVLDISKIEAGKMELVEVEYDMPSLINDTVTQNTMRIGEKPIQFNLVISEDMFTHLYGDELRVRQIMNNLLSNAIKYTEEGVVELEIKCERDGGDVWLTIIVSDTGRGVIDSDFDKLFMNYSQLDMESNRKIEGTGLGLPIAKTLSEMMDGYIKVDSVYGQGSVFTVRIKQKFVTSATLDRDVIESLKGFRYTSGKLDLNVRLNRVSLPYAKVLVVDDNITNLEVAKGLMKPYGMQIDCVINGQMAIDAIKSESVIYNAIFMDHMMPGMDGIEALVRIRDIGTEYAETIPIIALTANAITGNEEMFYENGFQAFLSKPIDISRLDEVIRRWVRNKDIERSIAEKEQEEEREREARKSLEMANKPGLPSMIERRSGVERRNKDNRRKGDDRRSGFDRRDSSLHLTGLNIEYGIKRFNGDKNIYFHILHSYASSSRPLAKSIEQFDENNLHDYAIVVHGLKGASRGIFANTIGDAAEGLEKAAKSGDIDYIKTHNQDFLNDIWKLILDIEKKIPTEAAEPGR